MGSYALLLTDVVDSTRLTEELGDAVMAERWVAHDRVARDLLRLHHGREIDRTDGFLLLFTSAHEAAAYALAYHRALAGLGMKARAGLHVGPVVLFENAAEDVALGAKPVEVEGLAKPLAARVMSVATGGQTLASADAVAALGLAPTAPEGRGQGDGWLVVSHGHWQLKGVTDPVELFELGVGGEAPFVPPPDAPKAWRVRWHGEGWVPVREVPRNLPAERDAFVGREVDLRAVADLLDEGARLVTVLGIGGTGKTRLATRFAWTWLGDYPGGAWFCDLSEARDLEGIARAVAVALDVPLGKDDPVVQLGHAIAGRGRCLVVLDNFEQVARFATGTLGRWLDRASDARFLVTTREVLGLPGETSLALAPLRPDESVALFVARALQAKRDFALTSADRSHVEALVKLLDGLPLAVELAAARVRVMPPETLLARMSERFKLLASTGGRHTRQATLKATLDWSWELLSADEQAALAQLSVFEGGFTLDAAEQVLHLDATWPVDAVQALVDKSLVHRTPDERLGLLMSVAEYAAGKLDASGGRAAAERRHGQAMTPWGERVGASGREVARAHARARELPNLLAASRRAVARGDAEVAALTAAAASQVLRRTGPIPLAMEVLEAAATLRLSAESRASLDLARSDVARLLGRLAESEALAEGVLRELPGVDTIAALNQRSNAASALGRFHEARATLEEAVALAGEDSPDALVLHYGLGNLDLQGGRPADAIRRYARVLAQGDPGAELTMLALGGMGLCAASSGDPQEAERRYREALALARAHGRRSSEALLLSNLGMLHGGQGDLAGARAALVAALAIDRDLGTRGPEGVHLMRLGNLHLAQREHGAAIACFEAAGRALEEARDDANARLVRVNLAAAHLATHDPERAVAEIDAVLEAITQSGQAGFVAATRRVRAAARLALGDAEGAADDATAASAAFQTSGDRRQEALTLPILARACAWLGRLEEGEAAARRALAQGEGQVRPEQQGDALDALADVLLERGDLDGARDAWLRDPGPGDDVRCLLALAQVALDRGDSAEARGWHERAAAEADQHPAAMCLLAATSARLLAAEGRDLEAAEAAREAQRLRPPVAGCDVVLRRALARLG